MTQQIAALDVTGTREGRRHPRLEPTSLTVYSERLDAATQSYLEGVAADVSLGGMFIATDKPLPVGALVLLEFWVTIGNGGEQPVRARALVRWRRIWRKPRGMGLEFVDFEGPGAEVMRDVVAELAREPRPS